MPADIRERIFEHGFSTKPAGADGRGVGLALVRAITDAAGGTLELTGDPTTFRVVLPAQARVMINVLVVDDEHLTRELHREYVGRIPGFQVVAECASARAALTAVLETPPAEGIDLVLLDMTMPDGHGLDVARHIRARAADVDIIAITESATPMWCAPPSASASCSTSSSRSRSRPSAIGSSSTPTIGNG